MRNLILAAGILALPTLAAAHEFTTGDLVIGHPMAFETPAAARTGAGYLTVTNKGEAPDALIGIRADFPKVELHKSEEIDGIATMTAVEKLEIPVGETVKLAPGGYHVMFMGLGGNKFEEGEKIPATLIFENAGEVDVEFDVEKRDGEAGMSCGD